MLRWLTPRVPRRWPTTTEEWAVREAALQRRLHSAAIEVAERINEAELAEEMRSYPYQEFPAAEYLGELNRRSRGSGDRAHRLAGSRHRAAKDDPPRTDY